MADARPARAVEPLAQFFVGGLGLFGSLRISIAGAKEGRLANRERLACVVEDSGVERRLAVAPPKDDLADELCRWRWSRYSGLVGLVGSTDVPRVERLSRARCLDRRRLLEPRLEGRRSGCLDGCS